MAARCSRISWPVPPLLLVLQSFILKNLSRAQGGEAVLFTDVAFRFAWFSALACLWWDEESWMPQILLEMWAQKHQAFLSCPIPESGYWWSMLPFPRPPHPDLAVGVTSHLCPWPAHWSSSVFAILSCLLPAGSPKGVFRVSWQSGRHRGCSWPYKGGRWRAKKKKKKPPIQTHTNLLWLGLYWSLIDPYCCLFWTQSDGLWPSLTLMRSWVQAKNTATTYAVVTPQLGWKWPKDVFQFMNRALFCPAAWQEGSKRFKHY